MPEAIVCMAASDRPGVATPVEHQTPSRCAKAPSPTTPQLSDYRVSNESSESVWFGNFALVADAAVA
jgi:hypothetical protein